MVTSFWRHAPYNGHVRAVLRHVWNMLTCDTLTTRVVSWLARKCVHDLCLTSFQCVTSRHVISPPRGWHVIERGHQADGLTSAWMRSQWQSWRKVTHSQVDGWDPVAPCTAPVYVDIGLGWSTGWKMFVSVQNNSQNYGWIFRNLEISDNL